MIQTMNNSSHISSKGFTLIEVMVTITVLTIGILGAGAMQISVMNNNAEAYDMTEATALALDQIESIMTWDYFDARLTDDNDTNYQRVGDQPIAGGVIQMGTINSVGDSSVVTDNYTVYLDITDNIPAANSKTIRVDVVWPKGNDLKTVSMNFIKTRF